MLRFGGLLTALALLLTACAADEGPGEEEGPEKGPAAAATVTSDDGLLTVEIPPGALPEDAEITVRTLGAKDLPPELADLELRGSFYALEPDGLEFAEPVTITRRVDPETAGFDLSEGIPLVLLATRGSEGNWEFLQDQQVSAEDGMIVATGTTTHFSQVFAFGGGLTFTMRPQKVTRGLRKSWTSKVVARQSFDPLQEFRLRASGWAGTRGILEWGGDIDQQRLTKNDVHKSLKQRFRCLDKPGEDFFQVFVDLESENPLGFLAELVEAGTARTTVGVPPGTARCKGKGAVAGEPVVSVKAACATWRHRPFKRFPSFIVFQVELEGADTGAFAALAADGVNNDKPMKAKVKSDGVVTFTGGIDAFGPHPVTEFTYDLQAAVDLLEELQRPLGPVDVTPQPGEAGDCDAFPTVP